MPEWSYVMEAADVPAGEARPGRVGQRWCAVCNDGGTFYVADIECPHEGGPLGRGRVSDGCVICPVHHWPWDLRTGLSDANLPHLRLRRYPCQVRDGKVYADVTAPIPPTPSSPRP